MKGEMLGAFLLALMIFSFSVSLIPLGYFSYRSSGDIRQAREEGHRDLHGFRDLGVERNQRI